MTLYTHETPFCHPFYYHRPFYFNMEDLSVTLVHILAMTDSRRPYRGVCS